MLHYLEHQTGIQDQTIPTSKQTVRVYNAFYRSFQTCFFKFVQHLHYIMLTKMFTKRVLVLQSFLYSWFIETSLWKFQDVKILHRVLAEDSYRWFPAKIIRKPGIVIGFKHNLPRVNNIENQLILKIERFNISCIK